MRLLSAFAFIGKRARISADYTLGSYFTRMSERLFGYRNTNGGNARKNDVPNIRVVPYKVYHTIQMDAPIRSRHNIPQKITSAQTPHMEKKKKTIAGMWKG